MQQVAYAQNLLTTDRELRRLARSYLYHDLPYPAALVLEKGLDEGKIDANVAAYELLANGWIASREDKKSRGPLTKTAELSEDRNLYVRLGQVLMQDEDWNTASTLFEKAVEKGSLKDPGNAELLLGISCCNDSHGLQARSAFKCARKFDKSKPEADRWIKHLDTEEESAG